MDSITAYLVKNQDDGSPLNFWREVASKLCVNMFELHEIIEAFIRMRAEGEGFSALLVRTHLSLPRWLITSGLIDYPSSFRSISAAPFQYNCSETRSSTQSMPRKQNIHFADPFIF